MGVEHRRSLLEPAFSERHKPHRAIIAADGEVRAGPVDGEIGDSYAEIDRPDDVAGGGVGDLHVAAAGGGDECGACEVEALDRAVEPVDGDDRPLGGVEGERSILGAGGEAVAGRAHGEGDDVGRRGAAGGSDRLDDAGAQTEELEGELPADAWGRVWADEGGGVVEQPLERGDGAGVGSSEAVEIRDVELVAGVVGRGGGPGGFGRRAARLFAEHGGGLGFGAEGPVGPQ